MKTKQPSLFAALLLGLLANSFLRGQAGYWARCGTATYLPAALVLGSAGFLFAQCWKLSQNRLFASLFAVLLLWASVLELLRVWVISGEIYADTVTLVVVCTMTLLPVLYLRRVPAISQTGGVLLWLLVLTVGLLLVSLLPRMRVTNLQMIPLEPETLRQAAESQLTLYPEYLLPALWVGGGKRRKDSPYRLALAALGADVAEHFLLELFFGAALPLRQNPLHTAAQCGTISVFNRLEWIQLSLLLMSISLKLAVYLFAVSILWKKSIGNPDEKNNTVSLGCFATFGVVVFVGCMISGKDSLDILFNYWNKASWGFLGLVLAGGGVQWAIRR